MQTFWEMRRPWIPCTSSVPLFHWALRFFECQHRTGESSRSAILAMRSNQKENVEHRISHQCAKQGLLLLVSNAMWMNAEYPIQVTYVLNCFSMYTLPTGGESKSIIVHRYGFMRWQIIDLSQSNSHFVQKSNQVFMPLGKNCCFINYQLGTLANSGDRRIQYEHDSSELQSSHGSNAPCQAIRAFFPKLWWGLCSLCTPSHCHNLMVHSDF